MNLVNDKEKMKGQFLNLNFQFINGLTQRGTEGHWWLSFTHSSFFYSFLVKLFFFFLTHLTGRVLESQRHPPCPQGAHVAVGETWM